MQPGINIILKQRGWVKNPLSVHFVHNNINVTKFAKEVGITRTNIYLWLKGTSGPTLLSAMKIRKLTGLKFSQILACSKKDLKEWKEFSNEDKVDISKFL